jgi:hypothetical protein
MSETHVRGARQARPYDHPSALQAMAGLHDKGRAHCDAKVSQLRVKMGGKGALQAVVVTDLGGSVKYRGQPNCMLMFAHCILIQALQDWKCISKLVFQSGCMDSQPLCMIRAGMWFAFISVDCSGWHEDHPLMQGALGTCHTWWIPPLTSVLLRFCAWTWMSMCAHDAWSVGCLLAAVLLRHPIFLPIPQLPAALQKDLIMESQGTWVGTLSFLALLQLNPECFLCF